MPIQLTRSRWLSAQVVAHLEFEKLWPSVNRAKAELDPDATPRVVKRFSRTANDSGGGMCRQQ